MFRFAPRLLSIFTLITFVCLAAAQSGSYNLPVRAVVSYANHLTPALVEELAPAFPEADDLAFAIVDRYIKDGIVSPSVAAVIKLALTTGVLPHEGFIIYLADVHNGPDSAPTTLAVAQAQLDQGGVSYPLADADGNVSETTLSEALTETQDSQVTAPGNDYADPITPTMSSN